MTFLPPGIEYGFSETQFVEALHWVCLVLPDKLN